MMAQNHCVQLVGYDKTDAVPYWKLRNSWGNSWGEGGFIRLEVGKNLCGLANDAIFATAKLVAPAPKPAPAPPCPTTPTTTTRPMPLDFEELPMHRCAGNIINSTFMKFSDCAWWCAGDTNCSCFDYPSSCVRTTKQSFCSLYDTSDVGVPATGNFTAFPRQDTLSEEF